MLFTIPWPKVCTSFAPGSETRMWYFRPGYGEKSYTQHGDKEGHPRAKGCHGRVWNKILYVTRGESGRFFSWMVPVLTKRFFPRVITNSLRSGSKRALVKNLVARAVNPPVGKICHFRPCYIMYYFHRRISQLIRGFDHLKVLQAWARKLNLLINV